jgi:hypothetical protein
MRHTRRTSVFIVLALFVAGTACSVPFDALTAAADVSSRPASIVVASIPPLTIGQTTKLTPVVKDAEGRVIADASIAWGNSAPAVASIIADGTVTALSAGTVTFTAASGPVQGSVTITVSAPAQGPPAPPTPPPTGAPSSVQLPNTSSVETAMPTAPAVGGTVISVAVGGDLQAAINQAKPGDVIELAPNGTYTGSFILPDKGASTSWIVIRPASSVTLPAEGQRMTPQTAAALSLPRIVASGSGYAIQTALAAHHYRLVGLEITASPTITQSYGLVGLGDDGSHGQTTDASIAHHLVLDRMYIHGLSTLPLRRCVALNSGTSAVIDSWIDDCHDSGADAQAICGWNGPGPFKIINNHLEASTEVIMFGGTDPRVPNLVPSDIEVRHNHLTRPLSWKGKWLVKNLFELKNARRVLVEGNVMENNWLDGQTGGAIVLKSVNQDNTAPWSGTTDVTFRFNIIRNTGSGFHLAASPENKPTVHMQRVEISNNLMYNVNTTDYTGAAKGVATSGDLTDILINHNTILAAGTGFVGVDMDGYGAPVMTRFNFTNNIIGTVSGVGLQGQTLGFAGPTWAYYAPGGLLGGNLWAVGQVYSTGNYASYPAADRLVVNEAANYPSLGFTNVGAADFSLLSTSPAKGQAIGGGDSGVDMTALRAATNGAVTP